MKEKFRSLDIFGEDISLSYKGSSKFKTTPGAVASVIIISVLTGYALFRLFILGNRMYPNISKQTQNRDLAKEDYFQPWEFGFDMAFGLGVPLDPDIGFYTVQEVT